MKDWFFCDYIQNGSKRLKEIYDRLYNIMTKIVSQKNRSYILL